MQPQRETMTDRLADVIQVIHLGGRTGTLTVERGEDKNLEEGFITFVHGCVADARVKQQNGLAAFNYLNTWRLCRYTFINHAHNGASASPPAQNSFSAGAPLVNTLSAKTTKPLGLMNDAEYFNGSRGHSSFPLRLLAGEALLQHTGNIPLLRLQWRLLLLVNGQRSVSELARLLVRNPSEVQGLLDDLERMGLIQQ